VPADEGLVGPVNLRVAPVDSVLEPGRPLHLRGIDLAGIKVRIGGLNAKALESSSTDLVVDVPDSLFAPCLRSGVRYDVELRRGRQRAIVSMAASSIPYRVSLDPGEHVLATAAVSRGCSVEVADSGVYLAMPFAWDQDSVGVHPEEIRAQVTITPEHRPANRKLVSRQRSLPKRPSPLVDRPASAGLRETWLPGAHHLESDPWDTVLPVETACSAAPAIGDSMLLGTARARKRAVPRSSRPRPAPGVLASGRQFRPPGGVVRSADPAEGEKQQRRGEGSALELPERLRVHGPALLCRHPPALAAAGTDPDSHDRHQRGDGTGVRLPGVGCRPGL
jgi:hypothetical protein